MVFAAHMLVRAALLIGYIKHNLLDFSDSEHRHRSLASLIYILHHNKILL
jgi:hypothetical protein